MDTMTKTPASGSAPSSTPQQTERYRHIVKQLISALAAIPSPAFDKDVETVCAFDEERDQYLLLTTGWRGERRQRGVHLYLRIRDGRIWIEEDWIEVGIAEKLLEAGVPKADIVLAFHPPSMRKFTDFAES